MKLYKRKENDIAPKGQADPYVIKASDGRYYLYATGGHLFSSDSLNDGWEYHGVCVEMEGQFDLWAPSVIELGGKYYMHYSSRLIGSRDVHEHRIRLAVSESPMGPFIYQCDICEPFSIDPHFIVNKSGMYLFYSVNDYEAERAGTYVVCQRMKSPSEPVGEAVPAVKPTLDQEIFERDRFRQGQHWHTIEGAFYFWYEGYHYLMYSGACYQNPTYFVGYATAKGEKDEDILSLNWKKYPDENTYAPLLVKNEYIEGLGHNSVLFDNGKHYVIYHGRDYGDGESREDARSARIDEMKAENGVLFCEVTI